MDQTGGEAAHGSQITNFRLGRGLPSETGDGWVAWPHRPTPIVLVGSGWIGYPYSMGGWG